jgi:hypothetical protein
MDRVTGWQEGRWIAHVAQDETRNSRIDRNRLQKPSKVPFLYICLSAYSCQVAKQYVSVSQKAESETQFVRADFESEDHLNNPKHS